MHIVALLLWSCSNGKKETDSVEQEPVDLTENLDDTQVRAGMVTDPAALFGGISAEGAVGDYKIYNNTVQFIIQAVKPSNYYIQFGGGLLDADIIRPAGQPGRDIIDEFTCMASLGIIVDPTGIEVISDGSDGLAHIRVVGRGGQFSLVEGAVENWDLIQDVNMDWQIDYILEPNSHLLRVESTMMWKDDASVFQPSAVILFGKEVAEVWNPTSTLEGGEHYWYGAVSKNNEVSLALLSGEQSFADSPLRSLLEGATPAMAAFHPAFTVEAGQSYTFVQYVGVGASLGDITDDWYQKEHSNTQQVDGVITDEDGSPVAGARVHILDGNLQTLTMAITDIDGAWQANIPSGMEYNFVATGRGDGKHFDLPEGSGWYGVYAESSAQDVTLASYGGTIPKIPFAEGYGIGDVNQSQLQAPGTLTVSSNVSAVVLVDFLNGDTEDSPFTSLVSSRPSGKSAMGYILDGVISMPIEPGEYHLTVHRGTTCEMFTQDVSIVSGENTNISVDLTCLQLPTGLYSFDPHQHSSTSGDGKISMEGRVMTNLAHGVDFHVSTEHDHIVDFAPLIAALGLSDRLQTIIGAEISPPQKGHFNGYPLKVDTAAQNNGAPFWWLQPEPTQSLFDQIIPKLEQNGVIQANHPLGSSGIFDAAGYNFYLGTIANPYYWSNDFTAMELINDNTYASYLPYYLDQISRGHIITPTSVSDSHTHANGIGQNRTFAYIGDSTPSVDSIMQATAHQQVVASRGAYIHATVDGQFAPGATFVGNQTLNIDLYAPTWMDIDTVSVLENGVEIWSTVYAGESMTVALSPTEDAHYTVIAQGDERMPMYDTYAWSMTAAFFIDVDGGGWTPSLDSLE